LRFLPDLEASWSWQAALYPRAPECGTCRGDAEIWEQ